MTLSRQACSAHYHGCLYLLLFCLYLTISTKISTCDATQNLNATKSEIKIHYQNFLQQTNCWIKNDPPPLPLGDSIWRAQASQALQPCFQYWLHFQKYQPLESLRLGKNIKCVFSHGLVGCADTCESPPNSIVLMEERGEMGGIPSI